MEHGSMIELLPQLDAHIPPERLGSLDTKLMTLIAPVEGGEGLQEGFGTEERRQGPPALRLRFVLARGGR
jgi:hypothetical protein